MSNNNQKTQDRTLTDRTPTSSLTPSSRASPIIIGSSDRSSPASSRAHTTTTPVPSTPPTSLTGRELVRMPIHMDPVDPNTIDQFKPYQSLMETELKLEYGKKLKNTRVIHQELLCCQSDTAARIFKDAKPLREAYAASDVLRKDLKEFVPPCVTERAFDENNMETKAIPLIVKAYDQYPLRSYQKQVQLIVDQSILEEVGKRRVLGTQSKTLVGKKDFKEMGIQLRLQALQSRAVLAVAQALSDHLRKIKIKERESARTDTRKAAAQKRLIVPNADDRVVRSLVHWLYCEGALNYDDAEHLYALHTLAVILGMTELAEKCLGMLSSETNEMIEAAFYQGMSLQQLLEYSLELEGEDKQAIPPAGNVVQVVFDHVLTDENAPKRLVKLVTETLAEHLDTCLWLKLAPRVNHPLSMQIISTILLHRQVKPGAVEKVPIKSDASTGNELMLFSTNKRTATD